MRISKGMIGVAAAAAAMAMAGGVAWAGTSAWQGDPPVKTGGWRPIGVDAKAMVMVEGDGIERHGNEARMWVAIVFSEAQTASSGPYSALLTRSSFDCQAHTWHPINMQTLNETGATLTTVDVSTVAAAAAGPDSGQAKLLGIACDPTSLGDAPKMDDLMIARQAFVQMVQEGKIK